MKKLPTLFPIPVSILLLAVAPDAGSHSLAAQAPAPNLSFEVASVKLVPPPDISKLEADARVGRMPRVGVHISSSRAEYLHVSLKQLISLAYGMRSYQVKGPDWLQTEAFDIEATIPEGASKDDAAAMLRSLLEERFKLVAHRATEEQRVLALVVGKTGPKLKPSAAKPQPIDENAPLNPGELEAKSGFGTVRIRLNVDGFGIRNMGEKGTLKYKYSYEPSNQVIHMESTCVTMAGFADTLTMILQGFGRQQVVDMTELKGAYELTLDLSIFDLMSMAHAPELESPGAESETATAQPMMAPSGGDSLFHAVEKLGLKLEERKAPLDEVIVDHVEKMPTEN